MQLRNTMFGCIFGIILSAHLSYSSTKTSNLLDPPLRVPVSTDPKWIQESLDRHNYFRSLHNAPRLSLNDSLSEMSQAWSNYLLARAIAGFEAAKNSSNKIPGIFFDHNPKLQMYRTGENLYYNWGHVGKPNGSLAVNSWYDEIKDYDFDTHAVKSTSDPSSLIGHFTAIVWKSTTSMGTAYATHQGYPLPDRARITFITANYYPGGNVYTRYIENVLPRASDDSNEVDNSAIIRKLIRFHEIPEAPLDTPDSWIDKAIAKHNEFREIHSTPPLARSTELCRVAQFWANDLLAKGRSFHTTRSVYELYVNYNAVARARFGESVTYFLTPDSDVDPSAPAKVWYSENRYYDFDKMQTNLNKSKTATTEHFEQLLWKETTHMGIAYATKELETGHFLTFIVANYYPSGPLVAIGRSPSISDKKANINSSSSFSGENSSSFLLGSLVMHLMSRARYIADLIMPIQ